MAKITKGRKGRSRRRIAFYGDETDPNLVPFENGSDSLQAALRNIGYGVEITQDVPDGNLPTGLRTDRKYVSVIAWVYLPGDRVDLDELTRLSAANGWKISQYTPEVRGTILRDRRLRTRR